MVEKHIKSLLYNHDCVIIPDFGGLIARYASARIHPVKHALTPPSKRIAFNEKLILNDGLLISTIAHHKGIERKEAQRLVSEFVQQSKRTLAKENRLEMHGIGIFRYNAEQALEFEYIESDNLLEASFGLPDLMARPVKLEDPALLRTLIKERQPVPVYTKVSLRKRLKRAANVTAGLVIAGLTGSALYMLSLQTEYNLSSLNPISLLGVAYQQQVSDLFEGQKNTPGNNFSEEELNTAFSTPVESDSVVAFDEWESPAPAAIVAEEQKNESLSPENYALGNTPQQAVMQQVETAETPVAIAKPEEEPSPVIKEKTGRFYIITGGYSKLENAEIARGQVNKNGQKAKVLLPLRGSKLFRVSVADFETMEEARASLAEYRKSFGETIWVLNN